MAVDFAATVICRVVCLVRRQIWLLGGGGEPSKTVKLPLMDVDLCNRWHGV